MGAEKTGAQGMYPLQLDRGNISQALSDNMLDDLKMNTDDYNTGQTIFYICFLCAELPSQLISKKSRSRSLDPRPYGLLESRRQHASLPQRRPSFFACRALLGMLESGFIPNNILYLSYFYTSLELPIRLSFFWTSYQFTSIVSAFLAFGTLHLRGHDGLAGGHWLFALEGPLTRCISFISFLYPPPSPTQTKSWIREDEDCGVGAI